MGELDLAGKKRGYEEERGMAKQFFCCSFPLMLTPLSVVGNKTKHNKKSSIKKPEKSNLPLIEKTPN